MERQTHQPTQNVQPSGEVLQANPWHVEAPKAEQPVITPDALATSALAMQVRQVALERHSALASQRNEQRIKDAVPDGRQSVARKALGTR